MDLALQNATKGSSPIFLNPKHVVPTRKEVSNLIGEAEKHELGTEFLVHGSLDSVSAIFDVHAFVVDEARKQLQPEGWHSDPLSHA